MLRWLPTFIVVLLSACMTPPGAERAGPDLSCGSAGPNTYYFPAGTFAEREHPDRLPPAGDRNFDPEAKRRQNYSETLDYLGAASLSCGAKPAEETYRLVWFRSFDVPVIVQASRTGGSRTIDIVMPNENDPDGKPVRRYHRSLSLSEWSRIADGLARIDFWRLPPYDELTGAFRIPGSTDVLVRTSGKDGARWIIEGRTDRYHVIDRWSDDDAVTAVGRIFLDLSGLTIPEDDIY